VESTASLANMKIVVCSGTACHAKAISVLGGIRSAGEVETQGTTPIISIPSISTVKIVEPTHNEHDLVIPVVASWRHGGCFPSRCRLLVGCRTLG
jgi:hypothetical protein